MSDQLQRPPSLVMRQGPRPNQAFPLHKTVLTLGRAADNDIVIDDAEVSRHHARLTLQGSDWILEDLGSRNGTFVNGQRITGPVVLRPGSQVALGPDVLFSMEGGVPVAAMPRRPAARRSASRRLLLAGLAVLVVAVLAGAATLAYFYLNPPTEPSAITELPTVPGPDIAFQEPAPGTRVGQGSSVLVFATARDENKVTLVDLWVDDQLVEQQASPDTNGITPLSLVHSWVAATPGTHALMVRAYNSLGATGESPVLHVTVSEEPEPATAQYVVQPGDTPATVAKVMSTTVAAIQGENPTIGPGLTPGQIIVVPVVVVVVPSPAQPAQPGAQPPAQPGAQPPAQPPAQPGGPAPGGPAAGGPAAGGPKAGGPGGKAPAAPPNAPLKAPSIKDAKVKDCSVTLTWQDNSGDEAGFLVYRGVSGKPGYKFLSGEKARKGTGSQMQYVDQVPKPATYLYYVTAMTKAGGKAASSLRTVTVPPTGACIKPADYKQIFFQPLKVTPTDSAHKKLALFFDIGSVGRRIPPGQGAPLPPGDWSGHKQAAPAPLSVYLNPGDPIPLTVNGEGWAVGKKPDGLGTLFQSHPQNELVRTKVWKGHGEDSKTKKGFDLEYKLWLEDVTWGQGTTTQIPVPTNLRFAPDAATLKKKIPVCPGCDPKTTRALVWDWTGDLKKIEGYILYRFYSCPGKDAQIMAPEVIPNPAQQGKMMPAWTVPSGCAARYQVSAYGPAGESKPSDPLEVPASAPIARVKVTFEKLTINKQLAKQTTGVIWLDANQYFLKSKENVLQNQTYFLDRVILDGKKPNNALIVNLGGGDSLQLGFEVSPPGVVIAGGSICESKAFFLSSPPNNDWGQRTGTYTLQDKNKDCEVIVKIGKLDVLPAGQAARPQADLEPVGAAVIGKDVYVELANLGLDPLTANRVKLASYWIDPADPKKRVDEQNNIDRSVSIEMLGDQRIGVGTIPPAFAKLKQLPQFHIEIAAAVDFDDPDTSNNVWQGKLQVLTAAAPAAPPPAAQPAQPIARPPVAQPAQPNCQPSGKTATRFLNDASFSVILLEIDGKDAFPPTRREILYNGDLEVELQPGQHKYSLEVGRWKLDGTREPYYVDTNIQFTQPDKQTCTITVPQPTIQQLLTRFAGRGCWASGIYSYQIIDPGTGLPLTHYGQMAFCFNSDGSLDFYKDESLPLNLDKSTFQEDGTYKYVGRDHKQWTVTFQATGKKSGITVQGTYYELAADLRQISGDKLATGSYFKMDNDPSGQTLYYWPIK